MDAPECLHRGQLWQFSAQYGGWLAIKLLLFNHALVVDPDVAAASPRRKRRSSLKLWMDLCLVGDIQEAQKEDGAFRRGSYSTTNSDSQLGQAPAHLDKKFRFSVQTKHQTLQFAADTAVQRDEWLHCLLLARKLRAKQVEEHKMKSDGSRAFLRFASSGSEESEGEEENRPAGAPLSWSEENALRSAQLLSQRSRPTAVQVSGSPVKFEE
ncbi:hypothetical protein BBO99_00005432 [Phytophthora kernoviae]|uniref:PH domain-containing protein n=2 Tax=Phytophthora kernoviae TaxID=325452 RepID=A0A3R7J6S0_9STRA|nr:hypothetical protein G195_006132 [Phytophthora kernoviae 00238/432]KAG2525331.1 hypothetical protein JM18_004941 [Phytophthora kernoviae]RLN20874.1 hypothetical protein BBI17_005525 [Phytophthora kernoviae]RLN79215.1 hypothetical protein BBO99_00005432 [Phytophthora kernoviae]